MSHTPLTVIIVPGLRRHVPEHWQSHLAAELPDARIVESYDRDKQDLEGRVADLEQVVAGAGTPVVLVAHSAGVLVTAHWAALHDTSRVAGALLATPPDLANPLPAEYPSLEVLAEHGWLPIPRAPLGFPSVVAASTNDALGDYYRVLGLATSWGGRVVNLGPVGHLNPAAGYGPWPGATALVAQLTDLLPA